MSCKICGWQGTAETLLCREQMFGWGDSFVYRACGGCGCLQIRDVPADLGRFYPATYYSYQRHRLPRNGPRARVGALRDYLLASGRVWPGKALHALAPARGELFALAPLGLHPDDQILDVGAGSGHLLVTLERAGFRHLVGVDSFVPESSESSRVTLLRGELESVPGKFDLIMMHHVIEHVAEPEALLRAARARLRPGGRVLVRTPTVASEAFRRYGADWVQLDAPRHVMLHTPRSLEVAAGRAGLGLSRLWYDSTEFQFIGSELYRRGVPLVDAEGAPTPATRHLSASRIREFRREATRLNAAGRGDQFVAVLERR